MKSYAINIIHGKVLTLSRYTLNFLPHLERDLEKNINKVANTHYGFNHIRVVMK